MIREAHGNLLEANADAVVNTVNTVGIMGKGIALQFKKAYPSMFEEYQRAANAGELKLGKMHVWATGQMSGARFVINFPTKGHWKSKSKLVDIRSGLQDLVRVIRELEISSIAIPPLGCGNGGLRWAEVEPEIRAAFADLPDVEVLMYPPDSAPRAANMRTRESLPAMTPGRAALVSMVKAYTGQSFEEPSLIETQKLMYFLQEAGEPLRLRFERNRYGPYADNLRHVLKVVEGHYLSGYGDGSASVMTAEPLALMPGADEKAAPVLKEHPETAARIEKVLDLASGFESAYGLELLATVHWLASHESNPGRSEAQLVERVREWSPRKGKMFTPDHIRTALESLVDRGWLAPGQVILAR